MAKGDSGTFTEAVKSPVFMSSSDTFQGVAAGESVRQSGPREPEGDSGAFTESDPAQLQLADSDYWSGDDEENVSQFATVQIFDQDFFYCWDHPPGRTEQDGGVFTSAEQVFIPTPYTYAVPAQPGQTWRAQFQRRIPSAQEQFFTLASSDAGSFHDGK